MASSDLLSKIYDELDARLRELRPLVDEYESLLAAAAALELAGEEEDAETGRSAGPASPTVAAASVASAAPARRRGRPPGKRSAPRPAPVVPAPAPVVPEPALAVPDEPALAVPESGADASEPAESSPRAAEKPSSRRREAAAPKRAQRGTAAVAILAALEHGSHTVSELAVVTAMSGSIINNNLRRLQQTGTITRTKREGDGKAAYALAASPA
jgi:hypothetical protein